MLAVSSKCLLFPIFIYKVDNENCCVYNSNVAINVTILITSSRLSVFSIFSFRGFATPEKRAAIVHQGAVSGHPLSTPVADGGVSRKRPSTPNCIGAGVCFDRRPGQVGRAITNNHSDQCQFKTIHNPPP